MKHRRWIGWLAAAVLLLSLTGCSDTPAGSGASGTGGTSGTSSTAGGADEAVFREDFIRGADVSSLYMVAQCGGEFTDTDGTKLDEEDEILNCLKILQKHGVNWIRLRLWVDPSAAKQSGGLNDLQTDLEIAKRAKSIGLKFLLNFHYSDTWCDPGQQAIPESWEEVAPDDLPDTLYTYTDSVLKAFADAGCLPDMVQVGNELNSGLLWPHGQNPDRFAELMKAGIRAVKDNDPTGDSIRTMIHLANGGDNDLYRSVFDSLTQRGVEFDVIGLSYYPFWHGSIQSFLDNMDDISARYDKDVVCAETSYGYTLESYSIPGGMTTANIFGAQQAGDGGFPATVEGQQQAVSQVFRAVAMVQNSRGLGVFYWEPAWIPTPETGSGWAAGNSTDSWANQAVFSYEGQALPSIDLFQTGLED